MGDVLQSIGSTLVGSLSFITEDESGNLLVFGRYPEALAIQAAYFLIVVLIVVFFLILVFAVVLAAAVAVAIVVAEEHVFHIGKIVVDVLYIFVQLVHAVVHVGQLVGHFVHHVQHFQNQALFVHFPIQLHAFRKAAQVSGTIRDICHGLILQMN